MNTPLFDTTPMLLIIAYLGIVSACAERATELAKGIFHLNSWVPEHYQVVAYQFVSFCAGVGVTLMFPPEGIPMLSGHDPYAEALLVGLLASGGGGVWHDLLGTITAYKQTIKDNPLPTPPTPSPDDTPPNKKAPKPRTGILR